jgi:Protein of unknown function (DUF3592)
MNAAKAISAKSAPQLNRGCLIAFGSIFILMGLLVSFVMGGLPLIHTFRTLSWLEGSAVITQSRVAEHDGEDATYSPDIEFEYVHEDQLYKSDQWSTGFLQSSIRSASQSIVDKYPVGSNHTCFINPGRPSQAVLERKFQLTNLFGCLPLLFTVVGGVIVWFNWRPKDTRSTESVSQGITAPPENRTVQEYEVDAPWTALAGPQKLQPSTARMPTFLGLLVVSCFWNGLAWFGFVMVWRQNDWIGIAFLSLFVSVGSILIFASLVSFLKLFNPVITVAMSEGAVAGGETVDIAWETSGRTGKLHLLKISIIGEEVVTYVRGTDKLTDRKIFQRIPVVETADEAQIRFGLTTLTIPPGTMHSFEADNNKIVWSIEVHGVIRWWPDVNESIPFAIRPQLLAAEFPATVNANEPYEGTST